MRSTAAAGSIDVMDEVVDDVAAGPATAIGVVDDVDPVCAPSRAGCSLHSINMDESAELEAGGRLPDWVGAACNKGIGAGAKVEATIVGGQQGGRGGSGTGKGVMMLLGLKGKGRVFGTWPEPQ
jgi:hypothetical protein